MHVEQAYMQGYLPTIKSLQLVPKVLQVRIFLCSLPHTQPRRARRRHQQACHVRDAASICAACVQKRCFSCRSTFHPCLSCLDELILLEMLRLTSNTGHGEHGDAISEYAMSEMAGRLAAHPDVHRDPPKALKACFHSINSSLAALRAEAACFR